ncbi:MAG TPA: COX15/CtaA family protein, partial [Ilumatobacteraceae bacterium]
VVVGAFRRRPRRRDLVVIALLIALGWPMQGLVGAIVVLTHLNPFADQQHFLLSMVLVGLGTILVHRAGQPDDGVRQRTVSDRTAVHVRAVTIFTALALVSGTFVTGAGPHAGDERAKRFDIAITSVARVHSIVVLCTIGVVILLMWRLRQRHADRVILDNALMMWMVTAIAQAAIGYTQYFSGVPAALVAVHIAVATSLWVATVQLQLTTTTVSRAESPSPSPADGAGTGSARSTAAPGAAAPAAST